MGPTEVSISSWIFLEIPGPWWSFVCLYGFSASAAPQKNCENLENVVQRVPKAYQVGKVSLGPSDAYRQQLNSSMRQTTIGSDNEF